MITRQLLYLSARGGLAEALLLESDAPYCCLGKLAPGKKLAWLEQFFWSAATSKFSLQNSVGRSRL